MDPITAAAGGVQVLGGIAQYYQSQKAAGAAQSQLDSIKDSFNAIKPPDYDVSVMDPPNYIMKQVPEASIDMTKITPEQYKVIGQFSPNAAAIVAEKNPTIINKTAMGQTGRQAQMDALQKMRDVSQTGTDAVAQQLTANADRQGQIAAQSRQASVMQDAARRGQLGSGSMLAAQLQGGSDAMERAAQSSQGAAANAYQNKLAMTGQAAQLGGQIAGQENQEQAQNADIINAFNQRTAMAGQNYANQNANQMNQAQLLNLQNAQNLANQNVSQGNQAQMYNQQYGNQMAQQQYQNKVAAQGTQNQLIGNQANWQAAQRDYLNSLKSAQYGNQMGKANALAGVGQSQINMDYANAANTNKAIQGVTGAVSSTMAKPGAFGGGDSNAAGQGQKTAGEDQKDYGAYA